MYTRTPKEAARIRRETKASIRESEKARRNVARFMKSLEKSKKQGDRPSWINNKRPLKKGIFPLPEVKSMEEAPKNSIGSGHEVENTPSNLSQAEVEMAPPVKSMTEKGEDVENDS